MGALDWNKDRRRRMAQSAATAERADYLARLDRDARNVVSPRRVNARNDYSGWRAPSSPQAEPRTVRVLKAAPASAPLAPAVDQEAKAKLAGATTAVVHCDGSCAPNPGAGGWGCVISTNTGFVELCGGDRQTTNNRMELKGAIAALQVLPINCQCELVTDSKYLVDGATLWLFAWRRRKWVKKGSEIPNCDLWKALDALMAGRSISWRWVRGHSGISHNARADKLATAGRLANV